MFWPVTREMELVPHFGQMRALQSELNRIFNGFNRENEPYPAVNLYGNDSETIIKAEVPGVKLEDIEISVLGKNLSLTVERKADELEKDAVCYRNERETSKSSRIFKMPFEMDAAKVEAKLADGILTVKVPRSEESKPKKISIHCE